MAAPAQRAALLALLLCVAFAPAWADEVPDDEAPTPIAIPPPDAPPPPVVYEERPVEALPVAGLPFDAFLSPMASYTMADDGRRSDDGIGGFFSAGKRINQGLALELYGIYTSFDSDSGSGNETEISGGGVGAMLFPWAQLPNVYVAAGAGLLDTRGASGGSDYRSVLVDAGAGLLVPVMRSLFLRGDVRVRTDWNNEDVEGLDSFIFEPVANLGLLIPLGGRD